MRNNSENLGNDPINLENVSINVWNFPYSFEIYKKYKRNDSLNFENKS